MDFSVFSNFDFSVFQWIQEDVWCAFLDAVMPVITVLGEGGWIWIVIAVLLLFMPKYRKAGVTMAFALILMLILNDGILKNIFARPRPFNFEPFEALYQSFATDANGKPELLVSLPSSFSFPSGTPPRPLRRLRRFLSTKSGKRVFPRSSSPCSSAFRAAT